MAVLRLERSAIPSPGTSGFRTKGLTYASARAYYDVAVPGGAAAVSEAIAKTGDEALAAFFNQPFTSGSWYDVLPIATISAFAARLRGVSHAQLVRENAAWVAKRDLAGVYRLRRA